MAENESLDLPKAKRWHRVYEAVRDGVTPEEIALLAGDNLLKTFKGLREPVFGEDSPQMPLADLLDATEHDPNEINRIVRRSGNNEFVILYRDSTLGVTSPEIAMEKFAIAIYEKFSDQIAMKIVKTDEQRTFFDVCMQLDQARDCLKPNLKKFAQQMAADPNRQLRWPGSSKATKMVNTETMLNESLLGIK